MKILMVLMLGVTMAVAVGAWGQVASGNAGSVGHVVIQQAPPNPAHDPVGRLRFDAKRYGIHWLIECSNLDATNPRYDYIARGWDYDGNRVDISRGYWFAFGQTQEIAAYNLWLALQEPKNRQPEEPERPHQPKRHVLCKGPIGSEIR